MNPKLMDQIKQGIVVIVIGAIISLVPFYYQTSAMTTEFKQTNTEQSSLIEQTRVTLHQLEVKGAIDDVEIKQIKESLQRIEKKIDRLIEKNTK